MQSTSGDHFGALFRGSRDAILICDETGRWVDANPAAEALLGFGRDELLQLSVSDLVVRAGNGSRVQDTDIFPDGPSQGEIEIRGNGGVKLRVDGWSMNLAEAPGVTSALVLKSARDRGGVEEAGARLVAIVASSSEAIIGTTLDGTITHWNPAAERVYGYLADEAVGRSVAMLAPPELVGDVVNLLERVRDGERVEAYETTRLTKEGCRIEVSLGTSPVLDEDGNVIGASSIARDVTDRKHAERQLVAAKETAEDANRALRESEERFRGAFNGASIGMALVSPDGRFLQVNRALCGILGYPEEELLAKTFQDITHPEDLDADAALEQQLLAGEITTYQVEKRYLCKDERIAWVRLTVSLVHGPDGEPHYFVYQLQDVTPYKAAGAALREAEARYRTLVEQIPAAVYVDPADALGSPLYVSPRVESLLGYSPEEWLAIGNLWIERLHPEDRERVEAEIARARKTGEATSLEYRCIARDGRIVWVLDQVWLVRDEEGT
ncbi:MAG TPA: PAS domain S-box protein, partial [Thermomicrobiales bacterium]|nr:PAS domain S-box protein [Thermomicrobiales bacterium]